MKLAVQVLVNLIAFGALYVVAGDRFYRLWQWYARYGSLDYAGIALVFLLFVLAIFLFDVIAEEKGWIVHHWWD